MQIKEASFSSFSESFGLPLGGFTHLRIISDGSVLNYGQLFHQKTFVMPYAPRPICCHLETNTTGRTNRVNNIISLKTYHTFDHRSEQKSSPGKTLFLASLEVIVLTGRWLWPLSDFRPCLYLTQARSLGKGWWGVCGCAIVILLFCQSFSCSVCIFV